MEEQKLEIWESELEEIQDFYDWSRNYWIQLSTALDGRSSHILNFGLWDENTSILYDAQQNFRRLVSELLEPLEKNMHGLEIGCGIGGFAVNMLDERPVSLTCFDILKKHLEMTYDFAKEMRVDNRIELKQGNSMGMESFDDSIFDFAYCIESSFHYHDKPSFFSEAFRVLKPGSLFVLADITCEDYSKISFKKGNYYPSNATFLNEIEYAGFEVVEDKSIGQKVFNPLLKYVKRFNVDNRNKLTKYWELVLTNYSNMSAKQILDYRIYKLRRSNL